MQENSIAESSLMIHCGGRNVTRDQLFNLETPASTATHFPVAHSDMLEIIENEVIRKFNIADVSELDAAYGISQDEQQMFGVISMKLDSDKHSVSYGFRNDHGKKLCALFGAGSHLFVCDNLQFSNSGVINISRKHTRNIHRDLRFAIHDAVAASTDEYESIVAGWERQKAMPLTLDDGFSAIGRAIGRGTLLPNQASVAFKEWKQSSYEEFADHRNVYGLQQAYTEAAKKGAPQLTLNRHAKISEFFDTEFMH